MQLLFNEEYSMFINSRNSLILSLVLLAVSTQSFAYQYGNPSNAEQAHLEAINRARMNPVAEASRLGLSSLTEGVPAGKITGSALPPLTLNVFISNAARSHSNDMAANGYFSHYTQSNGNSPFDRMTNAGYQYSWAGENIAAMYSTAPLNENITSLQMHDNLFEDKNYQGRGHRVNILTSEFKEMGIGLGKGRATLSGTTYNAHYITTDFGRSLSDSRSFILGVVYNDANADGQYTIGEGRNNIHVEIAETGDTTQTASAGGWAIPLSAGTYTLIFTDQSGDSVSRSFTITSNNIKIDILQSEFSPSAGSEPEPTPTPTPTPDPQPEPAPAPAPAPQPEPAPAPAPAPVPADTEPDNSNPTAENQPEGSSTSPMCALFGFSCTPEAESADVEDEYPAQTYTHGQNGRLERLMVLLFNNAGVEMDRIDGMFISGSIFEIPVDSGTSFRFSVDMNLIPGGLSDIVESSVGISASPVEGLSGIYGLNLQYNLLNGTKKVIQLSPAIYQQDKIVTYLEAIEAVTRVRTSAQGWLDIILSDGQIISLYPDILYKLSDKYKSSNTFALQIGMPESFGYVDNDVNGDGISDLIFIYNMGGEYQLIFVK